VTNQVAGLATVLAVETAALAAVQVLRIVALAVAVTIEAAELGIVAPPGTAAVVAKVVGVARYLVEMAIETLVLAVEVAVGNPAPVALSAIGS
jgi:hypothetical protein